MLVVGVLVLVAITLPWAVLTGLGAHRRGAGIPMAFLLGAFFPLTWVAWYVRDERPYRRADRRAV